MSKQRSVDELRAEVVRLRGDGLSFGQIAKDLGISKSYSVKLSRPLGDRSQEAVTGHAGLSVRQRKFAKGLIAGKTQADAALDAAAPGQLTKNSASNWAQRTLNDGRFQGEFRRMLDRSGLSEEVIARTHAQNLKATKVVGWREGEDGEEEPIEYPDYSTRQQAVRDAWRLYGRDRPEPDDDGHEIVPIVITMERKLQIERMRGAPLPAELFKHSIQIIPEPESEGQEANAPSANA